MDQIKLAVALAKIQESKNLYFRFDPEVLDFTDVDFKATLKIDSKDAHLVIPLTNQNVFFVSSILNASILSEEFNIICWNIKSFYTFVLYYTHCDLDIHAKLIDLKIVEAYLGYRDKKSPQSFSEAMERTKIVLNEWSNFKNIYYDIYLPLISKVFPTIESEGLVDEVRRVGVHSYYEINGQQNGRLSCNKVYKNSFNPHSLGINEKESLKIKENNYMFLDIDFNHMEVNVLQWLTQDDKLTQFLDSGKDFYEILFGVVTGHSCDNDLKRQMAKDFFLPVVFGSGSKSLSDELGVSLVLAEKIISKLKSLFPRVFEYMNNIQHSEDNIYSDCFGRKRILEDRHYRARNFLVQSPAALFCLDYLIKIFNGIKGYGKILAHIHDGYLLAAPRNGLEMAKSIISEVLNTESKLFKGLRIKASCKVGEKLSELKNIERII